MNSMQELFDSIKKQDIESIKQIITEHPELVDAYSELRPQLGAEQETPLILAAALGQIDTVQFLLAQGADVNKRTTGCCEYDALIAALYQGTASLEIIQLLLDAGANLNSFESCLGHSPLSNAARRGFTEIAQLLLGRGAEVDKRDEGMDGPTPLMIAAEEGHVDTVKLLLKYHADPSITDIHDEDALAKAIKKGHESVALILKEAMQKMQPDRPFDGA